MSSTAALDPTTTVVDAAAGLAGIDWGEASGADLMAAAEELARAKAMIEAAQIACAERLEQTGAAEALGWASVKDYLTHVSGGHKGTGGGLLRAAQRTRDLPEVRAALAAGDISLAQARVIAGKVATIPRPAAELRAAAAEKMLDLVARCQYDATDLEQCFANVIAELDPDRGAAAEEKARELRERTAHHARFLSFAPDQFGGVKVRGYATIEETELVKAVLMPLAAPQPTTPGSCGGELGSPFDLDEAGRSKSRPCPDPVCGHDGRDPRDHGARLWDALVEACARLTATDQLPHDHGTTARLTVTLAYDDLARQLDAAGAGPASAGGLLSSGDRLSATAVRRLACDAEIIPAVLGADGQVLDVGRAQRLVTAAIWLALVLRDQHCAFPGCRRLPIACDAHHVVHWADGGPTSLDNLVLLCRRHHTLVHRTAWSLTIDPATRRPRWQPPPGTGHRDRMRSRPARPTGPPGAAPPRSPHHPDDPLVA